jgi:hypothetical protein
MLPSFCDIMGATTGLVAALISWFWLLPFLQSSKQSCIVKDTNAMKRFATLCKMVLAFSIWLVQPHHHDTYYDTYFWVLTPASSGQTLLAFSGAENK